jgi:hypothetical protein
MNLMNRGKMKTELTELVGTLRCCVGPAQRAKPNSNSVNSVNPVYFLRLCASAV